jgi:type IV pilus assembly protein PilC
MIMPMFANIYGEYGAQLPLFTMLVFNICLTIRKYIFLIIGIVLAIVFGMRYYGRTTQGRRNIDNILLNMGLVGSIIREVATVRFASALSMLIRSGTPILHALDITSEISGNVIIKEMIQGVKESVREGKSMAEPLLAGGIFPDMLAHMVSVGEESGELAGMLESASKFYEERVDAIITRLTTLFEPALIISIGLIVGTMIIAMFLPILGLAGAIR